MARRQSASGDARGCSARLHGKTLADGSEDAIGIQPALRQQRRVITVIDKAVGQAELQHWRGDTCASQCF